VKDDIEGKRGTEKGESLYSYVGVMEMEQSGLPYILLKPSLLSLKWRVLI